MIADNRQRCAGGDLDVVDKFGRGVLLGRRGIGGNDDGVAARAVLDEGDVRRGGRVRD